MSQLFNNGLSQVSAFRQSGVNNNYANLVPLTYQLFDGFSVPLGPCGQPVCGGEASVSSCPVVAESITETSTTTSITEDVLRSVRSPSNNRQTKKALPLNRKKNSRPLNSAVPVSGEYNIYTEGNTEYEDLDILARQQGDTECRRKLQRMRQLPRFAENGQGLFSGEYVNELLLPTEQRITVDTYGNIFGQPQSCLIEQRIDRLNGFGEAVNNFNYDNPCQPGSFGRPFVKDNFYITYALATQGLWSQRILQWATPPAGYVGPTGPFGPIDVETQGLGLSFNGQAPGSTMILQRRRRPYYFHFPLQNNNNNLPCDTKVCNLDRYGGFYFTTDPVGGSYFNYINQIGANAPITPPVFPGTQILTPGNTFWVIIDDTWPDTLFFQSTLGPFMGGIVQVVGSG